MPKNDPTRGGGETAGESLPVWPKSVVGGKYIRLLEKQIQDLRNEQDSHGNRQLFLDDVFIVYLLAFFNPSIRSLRTIEDLSQTQQVQKHLSIRKISKSTLSDFNKLADPERLTAIVSALRMKLSAKQVPYRNENADLNMLLERTVAVDGTFLHAVADVAWAVGNNNNHGAKRHRARLDGRVNVSTWIPETIVVPNAGESESDAASRQVQDDHIYIYDRGYTGFSLLHAHYRVKSDDELEARAHFVVRYKREAKNSPTLRNASDRTLTEQDRSAGIISDRVGYFTSDNARKAGISGIQLREVVVEYDDNGSKKTLRIVTNLMDVSASTIALLYRSRWQVELFFRWLKSIGNFGHLISHTSGGVQTHLYVTIIGIMLMYLHTGYRPSKYTFSMLGLVAAGAATLEEVVPILRERERRCELDRQSAARRRAKKEANQ